MKLNNLGFALSALFIAAAAVEPAGAGCLEMYQDYQSAPAPKAWARSPDHCGYATGRKASTVAQAKSMALSFCKEGGDGDKCRIVYSQAR